MKPSTAIFYAVILALILGCKKETTVSKIAPTTTIEAPKSVINPNPFPGFDVANNNTQDNYGCVGHVHNERGEFIGSGVLIAPAVVLTAGHVIEGSSLLYFITKDKAYLIEKSIIHPEYHINNEIENDLGILILSEGCDEIPAKMIKDKSELTQREDLTTVGFSDQIKKISKKGTFWYYGTLEEEPQYMKFLPLNGHIWFGDSGGAVFEDGGKLAGIISAVTVMDCTIIDQSAIRLDLYLEWISRIMQQETCISNE